MENASKAMLVALALALVVFFGLFILTIARHDHFTNTENNTAHLYNPSKLCCGFDNDSASEYKQDCLAMIASDCINDGFFVDVGDSNKNTEIMKGIGWKGVCFGPEPGCENLPEDSNGNISLETWNGSEFGQCINVLSVRPVTNATTADTISSKEIIDNFPFSETCVNYINLRYKGKVDRDAMEKTLKKHGFYKEKARKYDDMYERTDKCEECASITSKLEQAKDSSKPITKYGPIYVVSFAHNCCERSQKYQAWQSYKNGATKVIDLNIDTLKTPPDVKAFMITKNSMKHGIGYWIWKVYCLEQGLAEAPENGIVIYMDAGTYIHKSLEKIAEAIDKFSFLAFRMDAVQGKDGKPVVGGPSRHTLAAYGKMDATNHVSDLDVEDENVRAEWCEGDAKDMNLFAGGCIGVKNDKLGRKIVREWKELLSLDNKALWDDTKSKIPNCKGFASSRHDQMMLSLLLWNKYPELAAALPTMCTSEKGQGICNGAAEGDNEYGYVFHSAIGGKNRRV